MGTYKELRSFLSFPILFDCDIRCNRVGHPREITAQVRANTTTRRCCSFISYSWIHHISKWDQIQKIGNFPNEFWVRNWLKLNQWVRFWLILPLGSWNLTNIHPLSHWVKFLWLTWERVLKCIEWSNKLNLLIELQFSLFSICFSQDVRL